MAPTHYVSGGENDEQRGTYVCLGHLGEDPICCTELNEEPKIRVNVLAVIYTNTSKTGRLNKTQAPEIQVGYVRLSATNHQSITGMLPDDGDIYSEDFVMTKSKRPGYEFSRPAPGAKPAYITANLQKEVAEAAEKWMDGNALVKRLGKELSVLGWKMLLKHLGSGVDEAEDEDEAPTKPTKSFEAGIGELDELPNKAHA
jgi:hypothetical protein